MSSPSFVCPAGYVLVPSTLQAEPGDSVGEVRGTRASMPASAASSPVVVEALPAARRIAVRRSTMRDGKIVAKFFNMVAGRPYPPIGTLHDVITVQMTATFAGFLTTTTVAPVYNATTFTISMLGGYASYLSLFDQYRLECLEVWLEPSSAPAANIVYPEFASCIDLDDANVPGSFAVVADHPGALVGLGISGRYHKWKPHIATAAFAGAFTSYSNVVAPWIDSASPAVQHYGLKVAATNSGGATVAYNMVLRARVSFRAPGIN